MGTALAHSRLFGIDTPEKAVALMLVAQAEGRHPASVAQDYHIIQGRPSLKADAMLARFQSAGGVVEWLELTETKASAKFWHPKSCPKPVTITWTMEMAARAQLSGKDNYKKFPRQMLRSRVVSEGVHTCFPAVCTGLYTPEEVGDFEERQAPPAMDAPPEHENRLLAEATGQRALPAPRAEKKDQSRNGKGAGESGSPSAKSPGRTTAGAHPTPPAAGGDDPLDGVQPPKGPKPPPAMIGKDQVEELQELSKTLKLSAKQCEDMLAEFKVKSLAKLTAADALSLILRLRKQRDEKNKRKPAERKETENPPCPKCQAASNLGKKAFTFECIECGHVFEDE